MKKNSLLMVLVFGLAFIGCSESSSGSDGDNGIGDGSNSGEEIGNDKKSVWLWDKQTVYTIAEGVAKEYYNYEAKYTNFKDSKNYSIEYGYTINQSSNLETYNILRDYTYHYVISYRQNGVEANTTTEQEQNVTTTFDYTDFSKKDSVTNSHTESSSITDVIYDEITGLAIYQKSTSNSVSNEISSNSTSEVYYTMTLLGEQDGAKTYKYYNISTGADAYTMYKIKNGVRIEAKSFTAGDELSSITTYSYPEGVALETKAFSKGEPYYTITYSFPNNAVIREKLPTYTLSSIKYVAYPEYDNHTTVEVLQNSDSQLLLRSKTFRNDSLYNQTDTRYKKM